MKILSHADVLKNNHIYKTRYKKFIVEEEVGDFYVVKHNNHNLKIKKSLTKIIKEETEDIIID